MTTIDNKVRLRGATLADELSKATGDRWTWERRDAYNYQGHLTATLADGLRVALFVTADDQGQADGRVEVSDNPGFGLSGEDHRLAFDLKGEKPRMSAAIRRGEKAIAGDIARKVVMLAVARARELVRVVQREEKARQRFKLATLALEEAGLEPYGPNVHRQGGHPDDATDGRFWRFDSGGSGPTIEVSYRAYEESDSWDVKLSGGKNADKLIAIIRAILAEG